MFKKVDFLNKGIPYLHLKRNFKKNTFILLISKILFFRQSIINIWNMRGITHMHVSIIHHSHTACYRVRGSCYNPLAFPFQSSQVETRFRMNMRWSLQTTRAFHSIPNRERERTVFSRIKPIYHRNKDVSICIQTPKKSLIGEASARHWKGEKINDHPHNEINQNANEIINRSFVSEGEGKNNVLEYHIATEKGFFIKGLFQTSNIYSIFAQ